MFGFQNKLDAAGFPNCRDRIFRLCIISIMARGWESKSVEEQQAEAINVSVKNRPVSPEQAAALRRKQGLMLSRQRVLQQMERAQNPAHRQMLEKALFDLDAQLSQLP